MIETTYKGERLIGGSLTVSELQYISVVVESMVARHAGRHGPESSLLQSSHVGFTGCRPPGRDPAWCGLSKPHSPAQ